MQAESAFSYQCNRCGLCCHDKVISLSPYDLMRIARAAGVSTAEAIVRFTIRRGSILRFADSGGCAALDGARCVLHAGRPLACRLYPLGLERHRDGDRFVRLEPAWGSAGVYGKDGTVADFLDAQGVGAYFDALTKYAALLARFRDRIAALVDFERVEPAEFRRRVVREALAESGYDPNALIEAIFDSDSIVNIRESIEDSVEAHLQMLARMIASEANPDTLAAAAVMLAVSLGYPPSEGLPAA